MPSHSILLVVASALLSIRGSTSLETLCVYSDVNLCSDCNVNQSISNFRLKELTSNNGVAIQFCSKAIPLNETIAIENRETVRLWGMPGEDVTIQCVSMTNSGIILSNVTNIIMNHLTLKGCGISNPKSRSPNASYYANQMLLEKSSVLILNGTNASITELTIDQSQGIGLSMLNTTGRVNIERSTFENNQVPPKSFSPGGGLYIELMHNRNGYTECVYEITNCTFKNNTASNVHDNDFVFNNLKQTPQTVGKGGGFCLILKDEAEGNKITISHSNFELNSALWGGGLYAVFQNTAKDNQLILENVNFTGNTSPMHGGGGLAIESISSTTKNNHIQLQNCFFDSNNASHGGGLALYATKSNTSSNNITFNNCSWINNTAFIAAAVDLSSLFTKEDKGSLPGVNFINCTFFSNTIHHQISEKGKYTSHSKGKGVVYSVRYGINFSGRTVFCDNKGSALYLVSSIAEFSHDSDVNFSNNKGFVGGAITLLGFSAISVRDNSNFLFADNSAKEKGGAIAAVTINKKDLIDTQACFILYSGDTHTVVERNINFTFRNNTAGEHGRSQKLEVEDHYGHSIFISSLKPCQKNCIQNNTSFDRILDCLANFEFIHRQDYDISTFGKEIKLAENSTTPLKVIPGKHVDLPIEMTDEFSHEVSDIYHVMVDKTDNSKIIIDFRDGYISEKSLVFFGKPGDMANITMETINLREIGITFQIEIQDCPPGYVQELTRKSDKEFHKCVCSASTSNKRFSGIYRCNDTEYTALLKRGYWIGYDQEGDYGTENHLLAGYCPRGFCFTNNPLENADREFSLPRNTSIQALDKFICGPNRTGIVCGKCVAGHASYYHSRKYRCKDTSKCRWGWLFYILSEIVPVTIVFVVIMVFNVKLTTGAFNAFLYFAQLSDTMLITANGFIVFPHRTYMFVRINHFIFRMFNLNFFAISELSFCLWKSAQTLDLVIFKYVTIVYALLLVFIIIAIMKFCNYSSKYQITSKIRGKKQISSTRVTILHGLTGFLIMCYSECTRISLLLLTPVSLETSSQDNNNIVKQVVFYNGELSFFGGKHVYYAIPALFCLIFLGLLPPLLLLSYPLCYKIFSVLKISETKFVSILCKCIPLESFRPFFDSFQSSFKDNCRFFAGLYFMYRLLTLFSFAYFHNLNSFYLMEQAQLVLILTIHTIVQPYKKRWHNIIDGLIFMVLAIINAMTLFNYKHATELLDYQKVIHTISKVQTTLLYIPLFYMCIYISIITYKKLNFRARIGKVRSKKNITETGHGITISIVNAESSSDDFLDSDYHNRSAADDEDSNKF